jgi:hypothetical protein
MKKVYQDYRTQLHFRSIVSYTLHKRDAKGENKNQIPNSLIQEVATRLRFALIWSKEIFSG